MLPWGRWEGTGPSGCPGPGGSQAGRSAPGPRGPPSGPRHSAWSPVRFESPSGMHIRSHSAFVGSSLPVRVCVENRLFELEKQTSELILIPEGPLGRLTRDSRQDSTSARPLQMVTLECARTRPAAPGSARSGSLPDRVRAERSCLRPDAAFYFKEPYSHGGFPLGRAGCVEVTPPGATCSCPSPCVPLPMSPSPGDLTLVHPAPAQPLGVHPKLQSV